MKLKYALAGLAALGSVGLAGSASAAMLNGLPAAATQTNAVENVRIVCDVYGRCFRRPNFYYGGGPRFYGGYGYGGRRFYGGGPRFYGGGPRFYGRF